MCDALKKKFTPEQKKLADTITAYLTSKDHKLKEAKLGLSRLQMP